MFRAMLVSIANGDANSRVPHVSPFLRDVGKAIPVEFPIVENVPYQCSSVTAFRLLLPFQWKDKAALANFSPRMQSLCLKRYSRSGAGFGMGKREPKIRDKKERGEWAEMVFMERAAARGIAVSRPWGTRGYDFVVGRPGRFLAVQVKCTIFELEKAAGDKGYMCTVCSASRPYARGSFDFLAAYVIYEDAWYFIPGGGDSGKEDSFAFDQVR